MYIRKVADTEKTEQSSETWQSVVDVQRPRDTSRNSKQKITGTIQMVEKERASCVTRTTRSGESKRRQISRYSMFFIKNVRISKKLR